jgi:ELWxxDGT repeat protein
LVVAAILAVGLLPAGSTPGGEPATVRAECARDVGEIAVVGAIGDTLIVGVQRGDRARIHRTDGTSAGTRPITDIAFRFVPEGQGAQVDHALYFFATDRAGHGWEPWRTDGTDAGTALLMDIRPGRGDAGGPVVAVGPRLYLPADDGEHGTELWTSDGTPEGTSLVKDILPGREGISTRTWLPWFESGATVLDGALLFAADDGQRGIELWRSDGTPEGTTLVRAFPPEPTASPGPRPLRDDPRPGRTIPEAPAPLVAVGETLYFSVGSPRSGVLWRTDGTPEGTSIVTDATGEPLGAPLDLTGGIAVVGETLYVVPGDPTTGVGAALWRTDGTPEGTTLVKRFEPGPEGWGPTDLAALGQTLYFSADDGEHGRELWRTDGTPEGTILVRDIRPGPTSSVQGSLTPLGGSLYFAADDGEHGGELWRSDGTPEGTALVRDIRPGPKGWWPEIQAVVG